MTSSTEAGARTSAQLLFVSVDLGPRPRMQDYARNVAALLLLGRYATFLSEPQIAWVVNSSSVEVSPLPDAAMRVVRTSLASPWITVLAEVAQNSKPVGYGAGVLIALRRVLTMVMSWQKHRLDIAEKQVQLDHLRSILTEDGARQREAGRLGKLDFQVGQPHLHSLGTDSASGANRTASQDVQDILNAVRDGDDFTATESRVASALNGAHLDEVVQAAAEFGEVLEVDLIEPDDPRAN